MGIHQNAWFHAVVALAPRAALAAGGFIAHAAPFAWCSAAQLFSLRSIAYCDSIRRRRHLLKHRRAPTSRAASTWHASQ